MIARLLKFGKAFKKLQLPPIDLDRNLHRPKYPCKVTVTWTIDAEDGTHHARGNMEGVYDIGSESVIHNVDERLHAEFKKFVMALRRAKWL